MKRYIFHSLQKAQLRSIVKLQLANLSDRLMEQKLALKFADIALNYLAEIGYRSSLWRCDPVKRAVQRYVETPIAKAISGRIQKGEHDFVDVADERLTFKRFTSR
ncbi:MAG UNVERIFIED_CONTAM: hypothetical protein LVR29_09765 [Microcystis novacekii LVE1205-3]|jgi:ATP-dependent Clp protease ATP-binding subunit ClpB